MQMEIAANGMLKTKNLVESTMMKTSQLQLNAVVVEVDSQDLAI